MKFETPHEELPMSVRPISSFNASLVKPLAEKTVLVTRTRDQAVEFIKLLEQLGARVVLFPTIRIVPPRAWDECDKAINRLDLYDALLLTSANAAENFLSRIAEVDSRGPIILKGKKLYVVGEKTKAAVEHHQLSATHLPGVFDAKSLAMALTKSGVGGMRFLFPKGNLAGGVLSFTLREKKATVDEVIVYETVPPSREEREGIANILSGKSIDIVSFFSPSSVRNFLEVVPSDLLTEKQIAVIGATTANAARNAELPVHIIAEQPTAAGLVASIVKYYE